MEARGPNIRFRQQGPQSHSGPQGNQHYRQCLRRGDLAQFARCDHAWLVERPDVPQASPTIGSVDQILGDPVLRKVVTTTLNIPLQIAFQPLQAQEKAISSQLDISKFKDPKYVESFIQRYLLAENNSASIGTTLDMNSLAAQVQGLVV